MNTISVSEAITPGQLAKLAPELNLTNRGRLYPFIANLPPECVLRVSGRILLLIGPLSDFLRGRFQNSKQEVARGHSSQDVNTSRTRR